MAHADDRTTRNQPTDMTSKVYHKSVRYSMHPIEINTYRPEKKGINCTFDDHDPVNNEITVHYSCCDDPTLPPEQRHTLEDIEEEISRLESRIVKDSHIKYPNKFHMEIKAVLDLPAYDGQYDSQRSKAKDVYDIKIPKVELKEINKYYEKRGEKGLKDGNVKVGTVTYG